MSSVAPLSKSGTSIPSQPSNLSNSQASSPSIENKFNTESSAPKQKQKQDIDFSLIGVKKANSRSIKAGTSQKEVATVKFDSFKADSPMTNKPVDPEKLNSNSMVTELQGIMRRFDQYISHFRKLLERLYALATVTPGAQHSEIKRILDPNSMINRSNYKLYDFVDVSIDSIIHLSPTSPFTSASFHFSIEPLSRAPQESSKQN